MIRPGKARLAQWKRELRARETRVAEVRGGCLAASRQARAQYGRTVLGYWARERALEPYLEARMFREEWRRRVEEGAAARAEK